MLNRPKKRSEEEEETTMVCMYIAAATGQIETAARLLVEGEVSMIAVDVCILACMMCVLLLAVVRMLCAIIAHEPCWAMNWEMTEVKDELRVLTFCGWAVVMVAPACVAGVSLKVLTCGFWSSAWNKKFCTVIKG